MNRIKYYISGGVVVLVILVALLLQQKPEQKSLPEIVKIALRDVGNQLLLAQQDSTSLILPVKELSTNTFELTFSKPLSIQPNDLVKEVKQSLKKADLSKNYRVEVNQCEDEEVAYSYLISPNREQTIIPCIGRLLPKNCYVIQVVFLEATTKNVSQIILFVLIGSVSVFICFLLFLLFKKKNVSFEIESILTSEQKKHQLGHFSFYPEQNKLVKASEEISLSKKECELLAIFVMHPNQIVTRDDLTKQVWEDHGVFVGRSLDTYISKLRKILKTDDSLKLTNVHGVGYKLEVNR